MSKVTLVLLGLGTFLIGLSLVFRWTSCPSDTNQTNIPEEFWNKYKLQVQFQPYYPSSKFLSIYIFNISNRETVKNGGSPFLEEVGPYVYQIKSVKTNISIQEREDSFSYNEQLYYLFRPDLTNGSLTDEITTINIPYLDLATTSDSKVEKLMSSEYPQQEPFHKVTVDEFLFKGAYVPFGSDSFQEKFRYMPHIPRMFGHYFRKNGSGSGIIKMASGIQDSSQIGKILSWRNVTSLTTWDAREYTYCNRIDGSDGTLFPPNLKKDTLLQILSTSLKRHVILEYEREEEIMLGVKGHRYTFPKRMVEDASIINKENHECFCLNRDEKGAVRHCPIASHYTEEGSLKFDASLPHFLDGTEQYTKEVKGLSRQREKHQSFFTIEPESGILLKSHLRVQMNVAVESNKFFPKLKNVRNMTLPMYWTDEATEISRNDPVLLLMMKKSEKIQSSDGGGTIWHIFNILGVLLIIGGLVNISREEWRKYQQNSTPPPAPSFLIDL